LIVLGVFQNDVHFCSVLFIYSFTCISIKNKRNLTETEQKFQLTVKLLNVCAAAGNYLNCYLTSTKTHVILGHPSFYNIMFIKACLLL